MLIEDDSLFLYNLTLKLASSFNQVVLGQFLGEKKSQEILVSNGTSIQLLRPNPTSGKIETICSQSLLGVVLRIGKFRAIGSSQDLVVVTSDSGNLSILQFNSRLSKFVLVDQHPYAKNGFTRLNQGHSVSVDPSNRVVLLSALEKNKLLYKFESHHDNIVQLSSPLTSVHKNIVTFHITALDTGFENPVFVAIECDYSNFQSSKHNFTSQTPLSLNYYEFDQGINHLVKKKSIASIPNSSNYLVPLPSHIGGVLVFGNSFAIYDNSISSKSPNRLFLPIPTTGNSQDVTIVAHVVHKMKKKDFFVLLQTSDGDLFKLTCDFDENKEVLNNINLTYFDTIPSCRDICILKGGFLFANVLNNDKVLYQFESLGENVDDSTVRSMNFPELKDALEYDGKIVPRELKNLSVYDTIQTLCPMVDSNLVSIKNSVEMVTLSSQSYLKTLVHGIPTSTLVSSELPTTPTNIYTCRLFADSTSDEYLVISSTLDYKTLVLSIGEVVEEVNDSEFLTNQPTIAVRQVGVSSVVQIYSNGIRHIKHKKESDKVDKTITDWFPPAGITILLASANHEQVIIGMSNSEICYFEIDEDDQLIEYQERIEVQGSIKALSLVSDAQTKSYFAVVGTSDETIQVLSLQPHNCLETLSLQALSANCTSLAMVAYKNFTLVHIGMANGLYVRSKIDEITGNLSDTRIKYVGSLPVKLSTMKLPNDNKAVMVISTSTWLSYMNQDDEIKVSPLLDMNVIDCATFVSEEIGGEASVGLSGNNLVIFSIGNSESSEFTGHDDFVIRNMKLRYNPKKMVVDSSKSSTVIYTIQAQYNTKGVHKPSDFTNSSISENPDETDYSSPLVVKGSWASCIQVIDYENQEIVQSIELPLLDCTISMSKLKFSTTKNNTEYLIVGITKNLKFIPNTYETNYLLTFKVTRGKKLEFIHKTEVDFQPTSMISFNGKLLVGMSNYLRLYDLGQKQLLRKLSTQVTYLNRFMKILHQGGERIVVGDSNNSITFMRFDTTENKFFPIADDTMKRQITSLATLDYDSVVGGDKFGNIFVVRLPKAISKQSDEDWGLTKNQEPYLNGAGSRLTSVCEFYSHDIPISIYKGSLEFAGSQECIMCTGLQGGISLFLPLVTKQEVELLINLELAMRQEFDFNFDRSNKNKHDNLLGKNHIKFRSYYNPVKNVIDGDLIEKFYELNQAGKIRVSSKVDRTPSEVEKKISDLRERCAF